MRLLLLTAAAACLFACAETPAALSVSPTSVDFGDVPMGATVRQVVTLSHSSERATDVTVSTAAPFGVVFTRASLPPGESVELPVTFSPSASGPFAGALVITAGAEVLSVPLSARAIIPSNDGCGETPTCMTWRRVDGVCEQVQSANGSTCTSVCAPEGLCMNGVCEGFNPACDDDDACTTDSCDPDKGCQHEPITCEAASVCVSAICDKQTGCGSTPLVDGTPCGSTACGAVDLCESGECRRVEQTTPNCALNLCGTLPRLNDCRGAICPENPLPTLNGFADGEALSPHDVWFAGGEDGFVYRFDGGSLSRALYTGGNVTSLSVRAEDDVWVAMQSESPRRWDGAAWTSIPLPNSGACFSLAALANGEIACSSGSRVHMLKDSSVVATINLSNFATVRSGGGAAFMVVGNELLRLLGGSSTVRVGNNIHLPRELAVDSRGRAWVNANNGDRVLRFDATGSTSTDLPLSIQGLGTAGDRAVVWLSNSSLLSLDGTKQTPMGSAPRGNAFATSLAITGANPNDIWIQGQQLEHYDGLGIAPVSCGSATNDLHLIRSTPDGGAFAAGYSSLTRRDDRGWSPVSVQTFFGQSRDLFVESADVAWLVPENGTLRRFGPDGGAQVPAPGYVVAVWGTSATDMWVGLSGADSPLHHYDGTTWTATAMPDGGSGMNLWVRSIHGSAPDDVWALGRLGSGFPFVWRWNGSVWTDQGMPAGPGSESLIRRSGGVARVVFPNEQTMYSTTGDGGWAQSFTPYNLNEVYEVNGRLVGVNSSRSLLHTNDAGVWVVLHQLPVSAFGMSPADPGSIFVSGARGYVARIAVP